MKRAAWLLAGCGAAFAGTSCGAKPPDAAPAIGVSARAPAAPSAWIVTAAGTHSGIWRVDAAGRKSLSEGLADAGAPAVRHDGERVLFVAREAQGAPRAVHECAPDGGGRRIAVRHAGDCSGAAWLPDGRIVYSARPADAGADAGASLFVAKGDGTAGERITWGNDDTEPTVLSDGRILFVSARSAAEPSVSDGPRSVLCTVHPDGSGLARFHSGPLPLARPRQLASLDVECLEVPAGGGTPRRVVLAWDAPSQRVADPPAVDALPPATDGGMDVTDVVPLAARRRPQGHLSSVKPALKFGTLVAVDARSGGRGAAVRFRCDDEVLGPVPLERDGSFSVRMPADRAFRTEILDASGAVVAAETGAMWVRPGETRLCVGCHDDVETGPPNVRPVALTKDAVDLTGGEVRR